MSNDHSNIFTEYVKVHPLDETQMHLPILETGRKKKRLYRVPPDMDFCMKDGRTEYEVVGHFNPDGDECLLQMMIRKLGYKYAEQS